MKPNIIHSIVVCLAAFTLPFMVACSSQEESLPDNVTEAALYLLLFVRCYLEQDGFLCLRTLQQKVAVMFHRSISCV